MNLHRASSTPQWQAIAPTKRNVFQKIAARSGGFITPANIITLIGFTMVIGGLITILKGHIWIGLILLVIGRLFDVVDGIVAEKTMTKSALGELFDAAADKIGTLATVVVLIVAGIADWPWIVALVVPQIIILVVVAHKKQRRINLHPTRAGKLSMAGVWIAIVGLLVAKAIIAATLVLVATYAIIVLSIALGAYAIYQYARKK